MKISKILQVAAALALGYYLLNKKKSAKDKPGPVAKLVSGLKEEIKKPMSEIPKDVQQPVGSHQ